MAQCIKLLSKPSITTLPPVPCCQSRIVMWHSDNSNFDPICCPLKHSQWLLENVHVFVIGMFFCVCVYNKKKKKKKNNNINIEVVIWIENFLNCKIETSIFCKATSKQNVLWKQWWAVTKYFYFATVLKYIFQVSILYLSSFILGKFYFTTFQRII